MKKIIRLTESDLTRIVKRVLKEERTPAQIETLPINQLHTVIYDALSPIIGNDREADVTAALYNITKQADPCCAYQTVYNNYLNKYGGNMWEKIEDELGPYEKYHKISTEQAKMFIVNSCFGRKDFTDYSSSIRINMGAAKPVRSSCFSKVTKMFPHYTKGALKLNFSE
jgi:hypothetical protein